jgi:hypothetical protein
LTSASMSRRGSREEPRQHGSRSESDEDLYDDSRDELANTPHGNSRQRTLSRPRTPNPDPRTIYPDSLRDIGSPGRIRQIVEELTPDLTIGKFTQQQHQRELTGRGSTSKATERRRTPSRSTPKPTTPGDDERNDERGRTTTEYDNGDPSLKFITITSETSGGNMHLQKDQKLKGQENYSMWKPRMLNLATANGLDRYFSNKYKKPPEADEFDKKATERAMKLWNAWRQGDAKAKILITNNVSGSSEEHTTGKETALDIWNALQT